MQIKRLTLHTHNFKEQVRFYKDDLGLRTTVSGNETFSVTTQSTEIIFISSDREGIKPFYHFAFNIPQNKFNEAMSWASERVELIRYEGKTEIDFPNWNAHSFYFLDSAGNIIEFIARHDLKNDSVNKFGSKDIINVSEIGLPVKDVKKSFEEINHRFNIPVFSGNQRTFIAAGDDYGLFIIVPLGREWFPDYIAAEAFPMEIVIEGKPGAELDFSKLSDEDIPYKIISETYVIKANE